MTARGSVWVEQYGQALLRCERFLQDWGIGYGGRSVVEFAALYASDEDVRWQELLLERVAEGVRTGLTSGVPVKGSRVALCVAAMHEMRLVYAPWSMCGRQPRWCTIASGAPILIDQPATWDYKFSLIDTSVSNSWALSEAFSKQAEGLRASVPRRDVNALSFLGGQDWRFRRQDGKYADKVYVCGHPFKAFNAGNELVYLSEATDDEGKAIVLTRTPQNEVMVRVQGQRVGWKVFRDASELLEVHLTDAIRQMGVTF